MWVFESYLSCLYHPCNLLTIHSEQSSLATKFIWSLHSFVFKLFFLLLSRNVKRLAKKRLSNWNEKLTFPEIVSRTFWRNWKCEIEIELQTGWHFYNRREELVRVGYYLLLIKTDIKIQRRTFMLPNRRGPYDRIALILSDSISDYLHLYAFIHPKSCSTNQCLWNLWCSSWTHAKYSFLVFNLYLQVVDKLKANQNQNVAIKQETEKQSTLG